MTKLYMISSCHWGQKYKNWVRTKLLQTFLLKLMGFLCACTKQSTSYYYYCSTSPTTEHPPPEIMGTPKESSPARGILPWLCAGGDSTGLCAELSEGDTASRGLRSCWSSP